MFSDKSPDVDVRFPDYFQAQIRVAPNRLRKVYVVDDVSYVTKKSALRARRLRDDPYVYNPYFEEKEERGDIFQVITPEGRVLKEVPTRLMAEEEVKAIENAHFRQLNEILNIFGTKPHVEKLISHYTYQEMKSADDAICSQIPHAVVMLKEQGYSIHDIDESMVVHHSYHSKNRGHIFSVNAIQEIRKKCCYALYVEAFSVDKKTANDDGEDFMLPLEIAVHLIDYLQIFKEVLVTNSNLSLL